MILKNSLSINVLIQRENEIIKKYEEYLKTVRNQDIYTLVSDTIKRHNNHVRALDELLGR